jgi:O-succinylbenzoate synthase
LSHIKGNQFAKAALDTAWWDLYARSRGEPLWRTLGGNRRTVDVGADFGAMDNHDQLLEAVGTAVGSGFKRVKLKCRPGWDLEVVVKVRSSFPDAVVHIDYNSGYRLRDLPLFKELDQFGLAMIEQPLAHDDLLDHARLQAEIATPICLDESISSVDKARKAIAIGACKWINIKHGRVGGITPALEIHEACAKAEVPCWIGGMAESAVGTSHSISLATLPNVKYPSDIMPSSRFYRQDLGQPQVKLSGPSQITASERPGAGAEPRPEMLERLTRDHTILHAPRASF